MSKVQVKESPTHGLGVFATETIKKGELVTRYPADLIFQGTESGYNLVTDGLTDLEYAEARVARLTIDQVKSYILSLCDDLYIFGDPERHSPGKCAHIINDGVMLDKINTSPTPANAGKEHHNYYLRGLRCNCVFNQSTDKDGRWAVAIRDIQAGEELFTNYGYQYWVPEMSGREISTHDILFTHTNALAVCSCCEFSVQIRLG
jgi:SET domain